MMWSQRRNGSDGRDSENPDLGRFALPRPSQAPKERRVVAVGICRRAPKPYEERLLAIRSRLLHYTTVAIDNRTREPLLPSYVKARCGDISSPGAVTPDLLRSFRAKLRVLEREIGRCLEEQTDCCGVTLAQCHVLLELDSLGSVSLKVLSERLELDKSTLSRAIDSLVGSAMVTRQEDPANRRQQLIALSKAGTKRVADIHQRCDAFYQHLLGKIPEAHRASVLQAIALMADAMVAQRKDTGPLECCATQTGRRPHAGRSKSK
jgi:DNA-binding MarR family transcriptional regulator